MIITWSTEGIFLWWFWDYIGFDLHLWPHYGKPAKQACLRGFFAMNARVWRRQFPAIAGSPLRPKGGVGKDLVAQLVEQYTFNVWVLGSNPSGITGKV
jgi:hypothetical protein